MTPTQIRAARAGLGWTQERLASEADVNINTVAYWEAGKAKGRDVLSPALMKIQTAFKRQGIRIEGHSVTFPDSC